MPRRRYIILSLLFSSTLIFGLLFSAILTNPINDPLPTLASINSLSLPISAESEPDDRPISMEVNAGQEIIIQFVDSASSTNLEQILIELNAELVQEVPQINGAVLVSTEKITPQQLEILSSSIRIEPNYTVQSLLTFPTNDPMIGEQWALEAIDVASLWEASADMDITVAVIDSGVCFDHPDLQGRFLSNGFDFVDNDDDPTDEMGHGCAISGIIAATANNNLGIAGVAPNVNILPIRVLDENGAGTYANVISAIYYAVNNGADIINLSLGGQNHSQILEQAVNYAVANGVAVVAGTGNTGQNGVFYPARYPSVIAVGSYDENGNRSTFSTYGNEVDTLAPGENILTTLLDGGYGYFSGTSMAVPHVSGLLALSRASGQPIDFTNIVSTPTLSNVATEEGLVEALATATSSATPANTPTSLPPTSTPVNIPTPIPTSTPVTINTTCNYNVAVANTTSLIDTLVTALASPGADVLCLGGGTYALTDRNSGDASDGYNGLPSIDSEITIVGNGSTIERSVGTDTFRIFNVTTTGRLNLLNTTLKNGYATGSYERGGAIYSDGILYVIDSTITENYGRNGAGIFPRLGEAIIQGSVFSYNEAEWGGAIQSGHTTIGPDPMSLIVTDTLFLENTAERGGAVFSRNFMDITHSRFIGNIATEHSAALYVMVNSPTTRFDGNCVYGNTDTSYPKTVMQSDFTYTFNQNWWGAPFGIDTSQYQNITMAYNLSEPNLNCFGADYQTFDLYPGESINIDLANASNGTAPYTYSELSTPSSGILSGTYPSYSYTAGQATEILTYTATDANGYSVMGTVRINVVERLSPVNQTILVEWDEPSILNMTHRGGIPPITYGLPSIPTGGTISGTNPTYQYTVGASFSGSEIISYDVTDTRGASVTNSWTIYLSALMSYDETLYAASSDTSLPLSIDVSGGLPPYQFTLLEPLTLGQINGVYPNLEFAPFANQQGVETVSFEISDSLGSVVEQDLTILTCAPNTTYSIPDGDIQTFVNTVNIVQWGDCENASNTIELAQNGNYVFDDYVDTSLGSGALPIIYSNLTINGNGAKLERLDTAPAFRMLTLVADVDRSIVIKDLVIANGFAETGSYRSDWGGGIYALTASIDDTRWITLDGVRFDNNNAEGRGHAVYAGGQNVVIKNSAFIGNGKIGGGSTIFHYNYAGEFLLENNIFYDNGYGGYVILDDGYTTLRHNTFWQNSGYNLRASGFETTIEGNIFGEAESRSCSGSRIKSLGYNIASDAYCADDFTGPGDQYNVPSGVGALIYVDGSIIPTLSLLMDSPALDAIPAVDCNLPTDMYGTTRPLDSNGDNIANCEIGAFEVDSTDFIVQKTVDTATAIMGDIVEYTVVVSNDGPLDADGVTIEDALPIYLRYVSSSTTQGSYDSGMGLWQLGSLNVGQSATLTLDAVVLLPTSGTTVTNIASLAGSTAGDNNNDYSASADVDLSCPNSSILTVADGDTGGLIFAINSANNEICFPGTDTVTLATNGVYEFGNVFTDYTALPLISSSIIINGNNATIMRPVSSTSQLRFFDVASVGDLTINDMSLNNGYLSDIGVGGGAIYSVGDLSLVNTSFNNNIASPGGALYQEFGTLSIQDSTFSDNQNLYNSSNTYGNGGAMILLETDAIIDQTEFYRNIARASSYWAYHGGGAISIGRSNVTIQRSLFSENRTTLGNGGAIYVSDINAEKQTIIESTSFIANQAGASGGAIINRDSDISINNSSFIGNIAGQQGGALALDYTVAVHNSTFYGNRGYEAGAITVSSASFEMSHLTIVNNTTTRSMSAAFADNASGAIKHSILAKNIGGNCASSFTDSGGYNISTDDSCGFNQPTDLNNTVVSLSELGYFGQSTQSLVPLPGSVALDAIPPEVCDMVDDQYGTPRPQGINCEIGAIEVTGTELLAPYDLFIEEGNAGDVWTMTWQNYSMQYDGYEIEHVNQLISGTSNTEIITLDNSATSYLIDTASLSCGALHNYRIRSYRSADNVYSGWSNLVYFYLPCTLLPAPSNVSGTPISLTDIELTWMTAVSGTMAIEIDQYSTVNNRWEVIQSYYFGDSIIINGFACENSYLFRLRINDFPNYSAYSDIIQVDMNSCPLYAPSDLAYEVDIYSDLILTWTDNNEYEDNYEIERSLDGSNWTILATLAENTSTYIDGTVQSEITYYYRLRSYLAITNRYSDYSNTVFVTIPKLSQFGPVFTVNILQDRDETCFVETCSLREAINASNLYQPLNAIIKFDLPGNTPYLLDVFPALPIITSPVVVDGWSQAGWVDKPIIRIDTGGAPGFRIEASDTAIRGFVLTGSSPEAIKATSVGNITIMGNYIGVNVSGTSAIPNAQGIYIYSSNSSGNVIGGTLPYERNIISGNTTNGIYTLYARATIQNNIIGLDATGTYAIPNGQNGIKHERRQTLIGGTEPNAGNIISGNGWYGINAPRDVTIQGNYIGTDITGTVAIPNQGGILSEYYSLIGGDDENARNIISGNQGIGIRFYTVGPIIKGNYIGVDVTGENPLPNNEGIFGGTSGVRSALWVSENIIAGNISHGVRLRGQENTLVRNLIGQSVSGTAIPNGGHGIYFADVASLYNVVGGLNSIDANIIANNGGSGIALLGQGDIRINQIANNGGLGIDVLDDNLANANDSPDVDSVPNHPLIDIVTSNSGQLNVIGAITAQPYTSYQIYLYRNASCDSFGAGEGETYLGQATITTDALGYALIDISATATIDPTDVFTMTATNIVTSTSSEFSPCMGISPAGYLQAPTNLQATAITETSVTLDWQDNSPDETAFIIDQLISGTWAQVDTVINNTTQWNASSLVCRTDYMFRVSAYRSTDNTTSAGSTISISTNFCPPLSNADIYVTITEDIVDGVCDSQCSLREAVNLSNSIPGIQTIHLSGDIYTLINDNTITYDGEDDNLTGDLDLWDDVIILGDSSSVTRIVSDADRLFHVNKGVYFRLENLELTSRYLRANPTNPDDNGDGGIIANWGYIVTNKVYFYNEGTYNGRYGASLYNAPGAEAFLYNSTLSGNPRWYYTIYNRGILEIYRSSISGGRGVLNAGRNSSAVFRNVSVEGTYRDGRIINVNQDASLKIEYSLLTNNGDGNLFGAVPGSSLTLNNSIVILDADHDSRICDPITGTSFRMTGMNILTSEDCDLSYNIPFRMIVDPLLNGILPRAGSPAIDAAIGDCPATDYFGTVRPIGAACDIGAAESIYITLDPPTNLTGTEVNNANIDLTWQDNTSYETSYVVERSIDNINWSDIATLPADSEAYSDTSGVGCFTDYYYRVSNRYNTSSATSAVLQITTGCTPLIAPSNLVAISVLDAIDLSWLDNSQTETGFNILRRINGGVEWQTIQTLTPNDTNYQDNTVVCETIYEYQIEAYRDEDNSNAVSNIDAMASSICPVSTPISFTSTGNTEISIDLAWVESSANETGFEVFEIDGTPQLIATLPQNSQSYTVAELTCGTTHVFSVQAYRDVNGSQRYSDSIQLEASTDRCKVQPPANPAPMVVQRNSVEMMWQDMSPDETSYIIIERTIVENGGEVQAQSQNLIWDIIAKIPTAFTSYLDDNLVCGTNYWYRLQGYDQIYDEYSDYSELIPIITVDCPVPVTNTIGLYQDGLWMFRDGFDNSAPTIAFRFGPQETGWIPLTGDWDGDGVDGIGLYKDGIFALRDVSERGVNDYVYRFGNRESGWQPIVGDWNGDGQDTVGLYRDGVFMLTDSHESPTVDYQFVFGSRESDWVAITGDWTATGRDYVGLYKEGVFQLHDSFKTQSTGQFFRFGPDTGNWTPIAGDWDKDGITTIGVYKDNGWRLRNSNSRGQVDIGLTFGSFDGTDYPLASYRGGGEAIESLALSVTVPISINPDSDDTPVPLLTATPAQVVDVIEIISATAVESTSTMMATISATATQVEPTLTWTPTTEPTLVPTLEPTMLSTLSPLATGATEPTLAPTLEPTMLSTLPPLATEIIEPTLVPTEVAPDSSVQKEDAEATEEFSLE